MSAISSALLAAAESAEEESADSILERHVSIVFSGPDSNSPPFASHPASKSPTQHRGLRTVPGGYHPDSYSAHHMKSLSLTHSQSAVEGNWSTSDHWSSPDKGPPTVRTSASFGDGDLSQPRLYQSYLSDIPRTNHERTMSAQMHNIAAVSKHHQQCHLSACPHTDAERK